MDFFSLLKLKGFPVNEAKKVLASIPTEGNIAQWQEEKKWDIFKHHLKTNRHYRSLIKGKYEKWEDLPIMNKDILRIESNKYKYDYARKLYVRNTSGSTGKPFTYGLDYLSHTLTWLIIENRYGTLGLSLDDYQARLFGTPISWKERTIEKLKDKLANRYRFDILDLSDKALEKWLNTFRKNKFKYVYGYSFPIVSFANFLKSKNIVLKDICPSLKTVIVTAEMCSPEDEKIISETFGVNIANEYGASEIGIIGFGNSNNWKVSDELLYVEIVDDNDNPVPDGVVGRVICTPLFNKGTPFIRYEVGDLASVIKTKNGKLITNLVGRQEELAILPSGRKAPGDTVFYYVFKEFSNYFNEIQEYRAIQKKRDTFEIQMVTDIKPGEKEINFLKRTTENYLEKGLNIKIKMVDTIERTRLGKFRRFISEV
ncbi:MAG: phenylacetate--CoA ligase family protein [Chlorobi bacterium]|nr:phenylacetate--CoA ligase family protein [Chlorobiota bacterium]